RPYAPRHSPPPPPSPHPPPFASPPAAPAAAAAAAANPIPTRTTVAARATPALRLYEHAVSLGAKCFDSAAVCDVESPCVAASARTPGTAAPTGSVTARTTHATRAAHAANRRCTSTRH